MRWSAVLESTAIARILTRKNETASFFHENLDAKRGLISYNTARRLLHFIKAQSGLVLSVGKAKHMPGFARRLSSATGLRDRRACGKITQCCEAFHISVPHQLKELRGL